MIQINYKKECNRIKLHYTFGQIDSIELPLTWKYDFNKQEQAVNFIKLYDKWQYLQYCIETKNITLIDYAQMEFDEQDKTNYDDLFKSSYPKIFKS